MYLDQSTPKDCITSPPFRNEPSPSISIYTSTVRSLCSQLGAGTLTSAQLVKAYLCQIETHNPRLRALIHVAPRERLMALASEMDEERKAGKSRGVLHGIPIVVKWVSPFHFKDQVITFCAQGQHRDASFIRDANHRRIIRSSYALIFIPLATIDSLAVELPVQEDAFIIRKLRSAGAISEHPHQHYPIPTNPTKHPVIGKANLSELASYKTLSADGWSALGGQTINAYAAHASPGSSSAGNGVAVAAGMCAASVGTDTGTRKVIFPVLSSGTDDAFWVETLHA